MMFHQNILASFAQQHMEPFYATWERFKEMLERYPHHNLPKWALLQIFIEGLHFEARDWVEKGAVSDGHSFFSRTVDEAYHLLEDMAAFNHHWHLNSSMHNSCWERHQNLSWNIYPNMMEQSCSQYQEEKTALEVALDRLKATLEGSHEISNSRRYLDEQIHLKSTILESHLEEEVTTSNPCGDHKMIKDVVLFDDDCVKPQEFEPLKEIKPQDEEQEPFEVVLAQPFAELRSCSINNDLHLLNQEESIQNYDFYEDQITSMVIDSQKEREEQIEGLLEEFLYEEKPRGSLEDIEAQKTVDLSSSMVPIYRSPTDSCWPWTSQPSHLTMFKLEPIMKFPSKAHYLKTSVVGAMCESLLNLAKLKGIYNQDPYVVLFDTYYGRKPLFDERFSESQADDYITSASWEATQALYPFQF